MNRSIQIQHIGIVLAGGQSQRMGQDKALLRVNGRSFLDRSQQVLQAAGCDLVLVSRNGEGFIGDEWVRLGPVGGFCSVVRFIQHKRLSPSWITVVPVDMPCLSAQQLRTLSQAALQKERACYYENCYLPFVVGYNQRLQVEVARTMIQFEGRAGENLSVGRLSVKNLLHRLGAMPIVCHHRERLANVNTPEQWIGIQQSVTLERQTAGLI